MTNKEAIELVELAFSALESEYSTTGDDWSKEHEARDMAIKALEQEHCEDAVSRKTVDELSRNLVHVTRDKADFLCNFWERLQKLPPVTPARPKGHWIMTSDYLTTAYGSVDYVKCSCCGEDSLEEGNYCPNCGAKMEGEE